MSDTTDLLGFADLERLADFLLSHMGQDTRGKLMTEHPIIYAKLYPSVRAEIIIDHVAAGILAARVEADTRLAKLLRHGDTS
jgi:hypothetical protein